MNDTNVKFVVRHPNFDQYLVVKTVGDGPHEYVNDINRATVFASIQEAQRKFTSPLCDICKVNFIKEEDKVELI